MTVALNAKASLETLAVAFSGVFKAQIRARDLNGAVLFILEPDNLSVGINVCDGEVELASQDALHPHLLLCLSGTLAGLQSWVQGGFAEALNRGDVRFEADDGFLEVMQKGGLSRIEVQTSRARRDEP